jgi:hypothetical protein
MAKRQPLSKRNKAKKISKNNITAFPMLVLIKNITGEETFSNSRRSNSG